MIADKPQQVFWKDSFYCVTADGKVIGGRVSTFEKAIIRLAAIASGVIVRGTFTDCQALARKIIRREGTSNYYVFRKYVLAFDASRNEVHVYANDDTEASLRDLARRAGYVCPDEGTTDLCLVRIIRYLVRMQHYVDDKIQLGVGEAVSAAYNDWVCREWQRDKQRKTLVMAYNDDIAFDLQNILDRIVDVEAARNCGTKGGGVQAIGTGKNYLTIDLTKVDDAEQLWKDLFVYTDYHRVLYIFTGINRVADPVIQEMLVAMMQRVCYRPQLLFNLPKVDFGKLWPILIYKVDHRTDAIPRYARNLEAKVRLVSRI